MKKPRLQRDTTPLVSTRWLSFPLLFAIGSFPGAGKLVRDNLSKDGWSWAVLAIDSHGRTIWIADAHRGEGKRFVVHADEKLTAFLELELVIQTFK